MCHQQQMQYLLVKWIRLTSFYWFPPKNFFLQGSKNLCRLSNFHRVKKTSNFFKFVKYVCNSKTLSSWNWPTFSKGKRAENSHNTVQVRRSLYIESLRKHAPPSRKHRSRRQKLTPFSQQRLGLVSFTRPRLLQTSIDDGCQQILRHVFLPRFSWRRRLRRLFYVSLHQLLSWFAGKKVQTLLNVFFKRRAKIR